MNIKEFISTALAYPGDCLSYEVSRKLTDLFPGRTVLEGKLETFDLSDFERGGQCHVIGEAGVFNKTTVEWQVFGKELRHEHENAWFNVLWRDSLIDVLFLTWQEEGYRERHHWVIADTRELAEEFLRAVCLWSAEVRGEILVFDGGYWNKDEELYRAIKGASFDNLILPDALGREIQEDFARFFASRAMYETYGVPWKRGVLLIGPPGNGKTHTVKALVNRLRQPCIYVKSFKGCYGTDQSRMRKVFERARQTAPSIVVLEDLDSLLDDQNRAFFLNEVDGFAANTGVVILATTNHPKRLDAAILDRPSRFDRKYYFTLPAAAERRAYLEMWNHSLAPALRMTEAALPRVAGRTKGFSFAYLKELVLSSMMEWIEQPASRSMDDVIQTRAATLLDQMREKEGKGKSKSQKAGR